MRTEQIKIYKFEELSEELQEKAIKDYLEHEGRLDYGWSDYIFEEFLDELKEMGIELGQGDFEWEIYSRGNQLSLKSDEVLKALCNKYPDLWELDIPLKFGVYTNYLGGGLCGGLNQSELREECAILSDESEEENSSIQNTIIKKQVYEDLKKMLDLMEKTYNSLYEQYDYLNSEECAREDIIANELEFNDEGELI